MIYVWNGLLMLKDNEEVRLNHLNFINAALKELEDRKGESGMLHNLYVR